MLGVRSRDMVEVVDGLAAGRNGHRSRQCRGQAGSRPEDLRAMNLVPERHPAGGHESRRERHPDTTPAGILAPLTAAGIGMLLMIVMGMSGIYRGMIEDATMLTRQIGADLWLVEHASRGPFAEESHVPTSLVHRALAVPGVQSAREFVQHTVQRVHGGEPLRMTVVGLSWPLDKGQWVPLVAGRCLAQNHFEMIADESLGLHLRERVRLGRETYTVVGISQRDDRPGR